MAAKEVRALSATAVYREAPQASAQRGGAREHLPAADGPGAPAAEAHTDWPVLGVLRHLEGALSPAAPAAVHLMRRMSPARMRAAMAALRTLPSLGPGEPLAPAVRQPMESLLGRSLEGVRVHTSTVAQTLGVQAFASGQQVIFAPGRMALRSPRGLALLGNELAHVGQPLAFKTEPGESSTSTDTEERAADATARGPPKS